MKVTVKSKLEKLRADYSEVRGTPFAHFFCPILFKDEEMELCEAHIINEAFPNSSRAWTIQRKDVDNFYGSKFESDFVSIHYAQEGLSANALTNKELYRQFSPRILVNNESVDFYVANNVVPEDFTPIIFENEGETVQIGLKMPPEDFFEVADQNWEFEVSKDVRISALVSLLKAAHLTLFEMLGYRYGLSAEGYFVGRQILGEFFNQNKAESKSVVQERAIPYFKEFAHMVRPTLSNNHGLKGTITDGLLHICIRDGNIPWAFIVYIGTSHLLHAVMIPIFDQPDNVDRFINFLRNEHDSVEVSLCRFNQDHWEINKNVTKLIWPKKGILYPEINHE